MQTFMCFRVSLHILKLFYWFFYFIGEFWEVTGQSFKYRNIGNWFLYILAVASSSSGFRKLSSNKIFKLIFHLPRNSKISPFWFIYLHGNIIAKATKNRLNFVGNIAILFPSSTKAYWISSMTLCFVYGGF